MAGASEEGRGRLIFAAARLYRVQQRYRRAAELLEEAASLVRESEQDRVLWYGLSSALRGGSDDAAAAIATFLAPARRPAFFEDALEDYLSERLRRQAIGDIVETARVVFDYGSPRSRAQWAVVLDELLAIGRVSAQDVPSLSEELALARGQADSLYYRILAGGELDPMNPEPKAIRASDMPRSELSASEAFVAGYMRFGLRRRAYRAAREGRADMGDRFLLSLGYELQSLGMVTEGMRVGDVVSARRTEASEPELLRDLRFPRAFPEEFSRVTEDHQLKEALFYALVREESYFQPRVRSRVGAIGLSQLMPATAEDIARRRRMAALDLEDPQTNLDLGGWYFSWLETRVPTPMHAVAAYNGGQGRIRRWVEEWSWMTPLLFNEAIPMRETRFHVRKVLVSAVHYGYPRELFFEPFPQE
jgi:soluble lytic murein transglycosylase